jgi:DNA-binding transcriptional MerR regulator
MMSYFFYESPGGRFPHLNILHLRGNKLPLKEIQQITHTYNTPPPTTHTRDKEENHKTQRKETKNSHDKQKVDHQLTPPPSG